MNESKPVYNSVELIPIEQGSISPLISKVKVKVFHLGANRNQSYIDRDTALEMAKTIPGTPIVGRFREEKGDFTDHGDEVVINDQGVNIKSMTKPYGFVDLNAKVWFENFMDTDEFGNQVEHTYVVTEGYVWNGQYPELQTMLDEGGRPHSMELDSNTLKGQWAKPNNSELELFIVYDAIISKLCILGDDTEPCFLGSSVTPDAGLHFSKEEQDDFISTLVKMRDELRYSLQNIEGGNSMDEQKTPVTEEPVVETEFSETEGENVETPVVEIQNNTEEFAKKDDEEKDAKASDSNSDSKDEDSDSTSDSKPSDNKEEDDKEKVAKNTCNDDDKKKEYAADSKKEDEKEEEAAPEDKEEDDKKKYSLLVEEYAALEERYSALQSKYDELVEFKNQIENKEKDELIDSFYMLSDEDKADVIAKKAEYSLRDIKAELSMICVDKGLSFTKTEPKEDAPVTYNLNGGEADMLPDWLKAVKATRTRNN